MRVHLHDDLGHSETQLKPERKNYLENLIPGKLEKKSMVYSGFFEFKPFRYLELRNIAKNNTRKVYQRTN